MYLYQETREYASTPFVLSFLISAPNESLPPANTKVSRLLHFPEALQGVCVHARLLLMAATAHMLQTACKAAEKQLKRKESTMPEGVLYREA